MSFNALRKMLVALPLLLVPSLLLAQEACPTPAVKSVDETQPVEFERSQSITLRAMLGMLQSQHFRDLQINDDFSQRWLNNYLDMLDPNKMYLLQSDIAEFRDKYETRLDDMAANGDLSPAKYIFDRYRQRALARISDNLAKLENPEFVFDYGTDRQVIIDREEADWPANPSAAGQLWLDNLTLAMLNLTLSEQTDQEAREALVRRYHMQENNLRQQNARNVAEFYFNSAARLWDPHTDYFSPREAENFDINMSLSLQGIGAVLTTDDEHTEIVSLVAGGPAERSEQLSPNDKIIAIAEGYNCEFIDIVGWRLDEVVDMIRGEKGSTVRLRILEGDADEVIGEPQEVAIVRDEVKLEDNAAQGEVLEVQSASGDSYRLGVIDIPSFYRDFAAEQRREANFRSTTRDTQNILRDFMIEGVDGVIIDLRGNGGGSLTEAATLTDLFVDRGPVVQITDSRNNVYRNQYRAISSQEYTGPLVVLVDRLSASASEIFAGAIQDYKRGLVIGQQTFGKGTVQTVLNLPEGELKITQQKFYRITGASTQHRGVMPDFALPSFYPEDDIGESSYDNPLPWDEIGGLPTRSYEDYRVFVDDLAALHQQRLGDDPDLKYLSGYIALNQERREIETVSLNRSERERLQEYWENREEELLNAWKMAKGIPLEEPEEEVADASSEEVSDPALAGAGADDSAQEVSDPALAGSDAGESASQPDDSTIPGDVVTGPNVGDQVRNAAIDAGAEDAVAVADEEADDENEPDLQEILLRESAHVFADLLDLVGGRVSLAQTADPKPST